MPDCFYFKSTLVSHTLLSNTLLFSPWVCKVNGRSVIGFGSRGQATAHISSASAMDSGFRDKLTAIIPVSAPRRLALSHISKASFELPLTPFGFTNAKVAEKEGGQALLSERALRARASAVLPGISPSPLPYIYPFLPCSIPYSI